MKPIALLGSRGYVSGIPFMETDEAMRRVGANCGNLVFQYAVERLIDEPTKVVGIDTPWDPKTVRDQVRALVVPSANFLREGADFSVFVKFLEAVDLPLVFVGLGGQADDFNQKDFDFHPSVLRLFDLIKERSPAVSIRGAFTARVLERFGIQDVAITGCPSNFINTTPDFHEKLAAKMSQPMTSFITHADEPWPKLKQKNLVERRLARWTLDGCGVMIQQAVPTVIEYLRENNSHAAAQVQAGFEESLRDAVLRDCSIEEFRKFLAVQMRTYYSVDQWLEDSARFDFSVGLRLHGNMAAWQAGTPALWITHDSRTLELVETMALPSIHVDEFLDKCRSIEDAWERLEFDPEAYFARRKDLRSRIDGVFSKFGIKTIH